MFYTIQTVNNLSTDQRGYQVDAGHIVDVVHFDDGRDALLSTRLDAALENVRVVEVLHRLGAQVYAQVLQVGSLQTWDKRENVVINCIV